jgi:hypothetical protein
MEHVGAMQTSNDMTTDAQDVRAVIGMSPQQREMEA